MQLVIPNVVAMAVRMEIIVSEPNFQNRPFVFAFFLPIIVAVSTEKQ